MSFVPMHDLMQSAGLHGLVHDGQLVALRLQAGAIRFLAIAARLNPCDAHELPSRAPGKAGGTTLDERRLGLTLGCGLHVGESLPCGT